MSQNIFFCLIEVFIKFINNESIFLFLGELYMPPKSTSGPVTSSKFNSTTNVSYNKHHRTCSTING